ATPRRANGPASCDLSSTPRQTSAWISSTSTPSARRPSRRMRARGLPTSQVPQDRTRIAGLPTGARHSAERGFQFRHDLEQVADQADVGDLEDRRLGILVDGDDGAGVLDAGEVLDGTGNADRHVQLRRDDLAGLA